MATNIWNVDANGDWATAADWSLGLPVSSQDVVISTANVRSITHDSGSDTVHSLTVGQDNFTMGGGTLAVLTTASFADGFSQTGGVFEAQALDIAGTATLLGGAIEGSTTVNVTGTIAIANYTIGGYSTIDNASTMHETGQVTVGDATGVNATINNEAKALYNFAADTGIGAGAASASFINAGTLEKTAGTGDSQIGLNFTDTGTIRVQTGTIELDGPTNSVTGPIGGAGTLAFGGGSTTLLDPTSIATGGWLIGGATVDLGKSLAYAGTYTEAAGNATSLLNLGTFDLALHGAANFSANFGQADVVGTGTLTLAGTSSLSNLTIGGAVALDNTGSANVVGEVTLGDGSGQSASITNAGTATLNLVDGAGIQHGAPIDVLLSNAGTLAVTGGGTSTVDTELTSTGSIVVGPGVLNVAGSTADVTGSVSGTGGLEFTSGVAATFAPATLSIAALAVGGATVTLGASETYAGVFSLTPGNADGYVNLDGNTLSLSGADTFTAVFGQSVVDGAGSIALSGTATLANFTLGGTVAASNTGLIDQTGQITVGDGSGNIATFTNEAAGTYDLAAGVTMAAGSGSGLAFANAGLLALATGTSTLAINLAETGTLNIGSGATLNVTGASDSITGTVAGAGTLVFSGANASFTPATLSVGGIVIGGATVTLGASQAYAGNFAVVPGNATGTVNLGGKTLSLSGTDTFTAVFGQAVVDGAGSLALSGTSTIANFTLGGTAAASNAGLINATGAFTIGDGSGSVATFANATAGTYDLATATSINGGAANGLVFTNAGLLEMTGSGTSTLNLDLADSGKISVSTGGVLALSGATNTIAGSVAGGGGLLLNGGTSTTFKPGTALGVADFTMSNSAAVADDATVSFAGTFTDAAGNATSVLTLAGKSLTLGGPAGFSAVFGQAVVEGTGTLATTGSTSAGNTTIGGSVVLSNSGTFAVVGGVTVGNSALAAAVVNTAKGAFDLTGGYGIGNGSSVASTFSNAGLVQNTGTLASTIATDLSSTGTINVGTAALALTGAANSIAGTVAGSGTLALDAGTTTIAAGTTLAVAALGVGGAGTLEFLGATTYAGQFFTTGGNTAINVGANSVTLDGPAQFASTTSLQGSGTLALAGLTTAANFVVGGSTELLNMNTLMAGGVITVGDGSGLTASMVNNAGAVFEFVNDFGQLALGTSPASNVVNHGTFEKSGGTNASDVAPAFINTASVLANSGTLDFAGGVTNSGTMTATGATLFLQGGLAGTGTLAIHASGILDVHQAAASTQTVQFADAGTGELVLDNASIFAGLIKGLVAGDLIDITSAGASNANATFGNGVLTVTDGPSNTVVAQLHIGGSYTTADFTAGNDGHSGILITVH